MKVVYICGPYRARNAWAVEQHIRLAEIEALRVWQLGAVPICPHTMTRFYQGACPDAVWLAGDLELVKRCDAVYTVGDWTHSQGATAEVGYAQEKGIPIFHTLMALGVWMNGQELREERETLGPRLPFEVAPV